MSSKALIQKHGVLLVGRAWADHAGDTRLTISGDRLATLAAILDHLDLDLLRHGVVALKQPAQPPLDIPARRDPIERPAGQPE